MSVNIKRLIISVTIPLLLGSIAGIATSRNIENWYNQLNNPLLRRPTRCLVQYGPCCIF
jgi:tryptophan-rich sensory protein